MTLKIRQFSSTNGRYLHLYSAKTMFTPESYTARLVNKLITLDALYRFLSFELNNKQYEFAQSWC